MLFLFQGCTGLSFKKLDRITEFRDLQDCGLKLDRIAGLQDLQDRLFWLS
jgi:hypothetical protein